MTCHMTHKNNWWLKIVLVGAVQIRQLICQVHQAHSWCSQGPCQTTPRWTIRRASQPQLKSFCEAAVSNIAIGLFNTIQRSWREA